MAYIHIPKTGGGSIKHWWQQEVSSHHDMVTWFHHDLAGILTMTGQTPDTSFTVVRNTWRRLISAYVFGRQKALKKLLKRGEDAHAQTILHMHDQGIIPFLEWMREQDHHNVRCQARYSEGVEHVIRDHSPVEWQSLLDLLGASKRPDPTHRVQQYDCQDYMRSDFIHWVSSRYRDEIELFGFSPSAVS